MLQRFGPRGKDEEGFTLIELMVVVLIIAILIAIALPTFVSARQRAQNRAAQKSLRDALAAAKTAFTDTEGYSTATNAGLAAIDPSLELVAAGKDSTGPKEVSIGSYQTNAPNDSWAAAALSDSGTCFWIDDVSTDPGAGTYYDDGASTACSGTDAQAAAGAKW